MKVSENVLAVLSNATTLGNSLTLIGQLDRKMYVEVNKVLEAAGGKWNKKMKVHLFDGCQASDRIDEIILTGEVTVPKDEFGFFPTPPEVVQVLLDTYGKPLVGKRVLEPSAGVGNIALTCSSQGAAVDCYELMDANYKTLCATPGLGKVVQADFLVVEPEAIYDAVIMNPPFARQADIDHITHAAKFVKPGGSLVAVMSAGVLFRENAKTKAFRELVDSKEGSIQRLPEGAFKSSGTMVNTVVVSMRF